MHFLATLPLPHNQKHENRQEKGLLILDSPISIQLPNLDVNSLHGRQVIKAHHRGRMCPDPVVALSQGNVLDGYRSIPWVTTQ